VWKSYGVYKGKYVKIAVMTSQFYNDSIFWIDIEKVHPNPYQPRKEFDQEKLQDLADSIKMYGILQPLVVTRKEKTKDDGGLVVEYELISGERRLRASKLAGLSQVPALIRNAEQSDREKLELAIIENLQREDLNVVDRARAFQRLADDFSFKHNQIAEKVGKSREYVSNTLRILALPEEILNALSAGKISEGHSRPLLMLTSRPEEQLTLYKEVIYKKLTVREAEAIARRIAYDRVRKKERAFDPEMVEIEERFKESLGTRVHIERRDVGGKILIDFFSPEDLKNILALISVGGKRDPNEILKKHIARMEGGSAVVVPEGVMAAGVAMESVLPHSVAPEPIVLNPIAPSLDTVVHTETVAEAVQNVEPAESLDVPLDDRSKEEVTHDEEDPDMYSVSNFTV
jgi:ParB family chromosome partitioning protein